MTPKIKRRRGLMGYSLPEVMIVVLITATIASVGAPLMVRVLNFWRQTVARNDIERDVRSSLDMINRFLRQADRRTVLIDQVSGQPPHSRIAFTTEKGQTLAFYQSGSKLYMKLGATTSLLSDRLGFLAFSYPRTDDVSIVSVAITMQAPTYLGGKKALQLSIAKVRIMN